MLNKLLSDEWDEDREEDSSFPPGSLADYIPLNFSNPSSSEREYEPDLEEVIENALGNEDEDDEHQDEEEVLGLQVEELLTVLEEE